LEQLEDTQQEVLVQVRWQLAEETGVSCKEGWMSFSYSR
jgi:hypothetical protein